MDEGHDRRVLRRFVDAAHSEGVEMLPMDGGWSLRTMKGVVFATLTVTNERYEVDIHTDDPDLLRVLKRTGLTGGNDDAES